MSNVLNRTTKIYLNSVNTPDYSIEFWIINPDLSLVQGVPVKYWKIIGDTVSEMNQSEKDAVDTALVPSEKIIRKAYLQSTADALIENQGYTITIKDSLSTMYTESVRIRPNRSTYLKPWIDWLTEVDTEVKTKQASVDAQTTLAGVDSISIDCATLISHDPVKTISGALAITDETDVSSFLDANAEVTDADTGIKGPFYIMQELEMRKDLYNDTENPIYETGHTPILGSNGILQDHANRVSNLETIHGKLGWHTQQLYQALYHRPKDLLIYYGWLNSFNSATNAWTNEKVAQDMSKYGLIILGNGLQDPTHGDYSNTQIIIPRIKALNPLCIIFGYVSANQTLANFQTKVDQWNTLQIHGIFIDEAGYDYGKTRSEFNDRVDYVHEKTYSKIAFANAWNTDNILGTANDVSYPNTTYNSSLTASKLDSNDWILLESFAINTTAYSVASGYESKTDWAVRGSKAISLRNTYGVNFASCGIINNDNVNGLKLFEFLFTSSLMFSLDANGSSDTSYAASSAAVVYWQRPFVNLFNYYSLSPAVSVDVNDADVYVRYTDFVRFLLDFSSSAQLSNITIFETSVGSQGITGLQGLIGITGLQGLTGIQGLQGNTGAGSQGVTGILGNTGEQGTTGLSPTTMDTSQRILMSNLAPSNAGFLLISGTAYFVYLGKTTSSITPKHVEFHVSTVGSGSQTAEVGFFSSTSAPNKANQDLTKLVSTSTVDALNGTGVKRNTSAFSTAVNAGTHLWAGIRTAMATTQPTIWGVGTDMAQGQVLRTTSAGVLTGTGPWTGAIITAATGVVCPDLRGVLD
jgi:hypothetical protein